MFNNAYQNLELKIDLLSGGTITGLKEKIKDILAYKLLIICGLEIDGEAKLPVVCQPNIYITQTEKPDDWDEEEDGEFIPEDVYHLEVKNIYGYDIAIEDDVVTCSLMSLSVDSLSVNSLTSSEDEISAKKPVVEDMTGYSATMLTEPGYNFEKVYVSAVKNGNKLTFVGAVNITKISSASNLVSVVAFNIPSSIGSKLLPVQIGQYSFLKLDKITVFSDLTDSVDVTAYFAKNNNTSIDIRIFNPSFNLNTKYYFRYEATFLLSDNLGE